MCLVCDKLTSNEIKLSLWKFQVHIDTRKLIVFHMTFQYCLSKLRNAVEVNLSYQNPKFSCDQVANHELCFRL